MQDALNDAPGAASTAAADTGMPEASEMVLSTLNPDGSRRWLRPRLSPGRFLGARRLVAYLLIAIFTLIPHVRNGGKPALLLDIVHRRFTILGATFLPTDTVLLALLMLGIVISVFLVTAVLGRVWCGWGCPQTVYLEFVYRPIERLFDGPPGKGGRLSRPKSAARTLGKYAVYLVISMFLAHTFLAYFVGVEALRTWILGSPANHPMAFLVMAGTTALMMLDFAWFREQTCIVACPYGRLQSVLLDRDSLIVSYDRRRGEPRGKGRRDAGSGAAGDCVDCGLCVETCPTGIDIRDGLKMECIGCAQCIDACDSVMAKLGRPRGLVRYGSQATLAGEPGRFVRPRIVLYPSALLGIAAILIVLLATRRSADVTLLRGLGRPFAELPDGRISNPARLKITNRGGADASYRVEALGDSGASLVLDRDPIAVPAGGTATVGLVIVVPRDGFVGGKRDLRLRITDGAGLSIERSYRLLGPASRAATTPAAAPAPGALPGAPAPAEPRPTDAKGGSGERP